MKRLILLIFIVLLALFPLRAQETSEAESLDFSNKLLNSTFSIVNSKRKLALKNVKSAVIVVIFFSSWSQPCVDQAKYLRDIQAKHKKKNLFVAGLNADAEDKKDFLRFLSENKFNYPMAFADESLYQSPAKISKIEAIPQTLIIKDRKIEGVYVGAGKTAKKKVKLKIAELLK